MVLFVGYLYFLKLWNIIQLRFNEYVKLFITQFTYFSLNYEQVKEKILWNHKHDRLWCILLDEVERDLDEDVDNDMNVIDSEFGNYEVDCNTGSVANTSDIVVPDILLKFIVHHLDTLPLIVQPILRKMRYLEVQKHWKTKWKSTMWAYSKNITYFSNDREPFQVFEKAIDWNNLISLIVAQTNLYASQNGLNFVAKDAETKALEWVAYYVSLSSLQSNTISLLTITFVTKDLEMLWLNQWPTMMSPWSD